MEKNMLHYKIETLMEKVRRKYLELKNPDAKIAEIDADILLSDLRLLYELCKEFVKTPQEDIFSPVKTIQKPGKIIEVPRAEPGIPEKSPEEKIMQAVSREQNPNAEKDVPPTHSA